jgi:hypothetical protein
MEKRVKTSFEIDGVTLVSVRDYEVEACIKDNDVMHIHFGDGIMSLDPDSLKSKEIMRSKVQTSTTGGKNYCLVSYKWEPNLVPND